MKDIKISDLRVFVEFQSEQKIQLADFSYDHIWYTQFEDWGMIEEAGGYTFRRDQQEEPQTTHRLVIRYRDLPSTIEGQRVRAEGINYTIHKVGKDIIGKNRYYIIDIMQEEVNF